jgi:hypothetical protein
MVMEADWREEATNQGHLGPPEAGRSKEERACAVAHIMADRKQREGRSSQGKT